MDTNKLAAVIEGVLFATGDAVSVEKLAEITESTKAEVEKASEKLASEYEASNRGITLAHVDSKLQLCTKTELYPYLAEVAKTKKEYKLTDALLETLSIVAYKQPVTKLQVESIRGVYSDHAVN